jgi:hypothetical protein
MFEKLLMFALRLDPKGEVEQFATGVQAQMLLRLGIGAVYEAVRVVERLFLSSPEVGPEYLDRIDAGGKSALEVIKKFMGRRSLLFSIRNNFGFHFPKSDDTERAFRAAVADPGFDDMWKVYFSHHGFNSLFLFSDAVIAHGIASAAGEKDLVALQQKLVEEFREAAINLVQFSQSFFAAVWLKHFGEQLDAQDIVRIDGAPSADAVSIPFFIEIDGDRELAP